MKKLTTILILVSLYGASLFAQDITDSAAESDSLELKKERVNFFKRIINGFKENTAAIHELNKENAADIRAATRSNYEAANAENKGITKVKEAEGSLNKFKTMFQNMGNTAKELAEEEDARREEIKNFTSYRELLEKQREKRHKVKVR